MRRPSLLYALAASAAFLFATPALALSAADEAAIKDTATALAKGMSAQTGVFDASGALKRKADGSAVTAPAGTAITQGSLDYVNKLTGVESVEVQGSPAQGGAQVQTGGTVRASHSVDFQCGTDDVAQAARSSGGISVKLLACYGTTVTNIQGLRLSFCSAGLSGGVCSTSSYSAPVALKAGAYSEVGEGLTAGFACNSAGACRITVKHEFSQVATGADLKKQTQDAAASPSALVDKLKTTYLSDDYKKHYTTTAVAASKCVQDTTKAVDTTGTASTCDGSATVTFDGAAAGTSSTATPATAAASCTPKWECVREATQTATYARSCTRTFPITNYSCSMAIPTKDCVVTIIDRDQSSTCSGAQLEGASLVSTSASICTETAPDGSCTKSEKTEHYTFPHQAKQVGDCTASPYPLRGLPTAVCATGGVGQATSCEDDGWYQRTLSDVECTVHKDDGTVSSLTALTERDKPGCGVCIRPVRMDTCYAQPPAGIPTDSCENAGIDPASCSLSSSTPESTISGLTESQRDEYTCRTSETSCAERRLAKGSCVPTDIAHGTDAPPVTTGDNQPAMNEALAGAAVLDELGKSVNGTEPGEVPRVFGATPVGGSQCRRGSKNCCDLNLTKAGGAVFQTKCEAPEVELAALRRSNLAHFVGEYCSSKFFGHCTQRTQTYCTYSGLLARIVQEQGRQQLAEIAASPLATPATSNLAFSYYASTPTGQWTKPVELNGVKIAAWQTPSVCQNPTGDEAVNCPSALTQWFAACDRPSGCSDLPLAPEFGSDTWQIAALNPLENKLAAISATATVAGACNTETASCAYAATALPPASGGRAMVTRTLRFPLAIAPLPSGEVPNLKGGLLVHGDVLIQPYSQLGALGAVMTPPPVQISLNSGLSWSQLTLPQAISAPMSLGGTHLQVSGGCDRMANICTYRVTGEVTVTAKPWGPPQHPDCSGFTIGQLSVLDFSKMDLSEWVASVMNKVKAPDAEALAKEGSAEGQRYFDVYQQSDGAPVKQSATVPMAAKTAALSPTKGWGPFTTTLRVTSNYPQIFAGADGQPDPALNSDPVNGVQVDWGDCTPPEQATLYNGILRGAGPDGTTREYAASGFMATHTYAAPDKIACTDRGPRNIEHLVKLTIYSRSGIHETTAKLLNMWTGPSTSNGMSEGQNGSTAITIQAQ